MSKSTPEILVIDDDDDDAEVAAATAHMITDFNTNSNNNSNNNSDKITKPATNNGSNNNNNNNNNHIMEVDDEDDEEDTQQQPITHQPQPNYERQFKANIMKPLHNILDSTTQDETLSLVRMELFVVMQGLYLEARRVYANDNNNNDDHDGDGDGDSGNDDNNDTKGKIADAKSSSAAACLNSFTKKNEEFDDDYFLTAPGLYTPHEDNTYEYNMNECTFVDPDAELITKKKLLPQVMKMVLKLGDGGGDRKTSFTECCCLSFLAEDLVACMLLDFVGLISKILSLVDFVDGGTDSDTGSDTGRDGIETGVGGRRKEPHSDELEANSLSNKRRRIGDKEGIPSYNDTTETQKQNIATATTTTTTTTTKTTTSTNNDPPLPNILEYIGNDMLSVFTRILASEACYAGYNQSLRLLRREDLSRETNVEDAVHTYLPSFFKSHPFDDILDMTSTTLPTSSSSSPPPAKTTNDSHNEDSNMSLPASGRTNNAIGDEYLSPLRTGEWRDYYILYLTPSRDISSNGFKSIDSSPANYELRDEAPSSTSISRHLISMARYFVKKGGMGYLNRIIALNLRNTDKADRMRKRERKMQQVNVTNLQTAIAIARSISFLSSYCVANTTNETDNTKTICISNADTDRGIDCLSMSSTMGALITFRKTFKRVLEYMVDGIQNLSQYEHRTILDILGSLEERSLTEEECTRLLCTANASTSTTLTGVISPYLDQTTTESSEIRLLLLWKLFTGQNLLENVKDIPASAPVAPSLQCQILALNEIIAWVKNLENMARSRRDYYVDMTNPTSDVNVLLAEAEKLTQSDQLNGGNSGTATCSTSPIMNNTNGIVVTDEMPRLIPHFSDIKIHKDILEGGDDKDNDSTEVCYNSNDSISSTNTELNGNTNITESQGQKVEPIGDGDGIDSNSFQRGALSYQIFQETESRLYGVLDLLKTKYNILGHLFSPLGLHSELLKRTLPLLEVFARNGKLREEEIKMIWDVTGFTSCDKQVNLHVHVSVTSAIFELMLGLLNTNNSWVPLGTTVISYFGHLFSEVKDRSRWTAQSLSLVESVAHRSIDLVVFEIMSNKDQNDNFQVPAGVDLLWLLSQDESLVNNDSKRRDNADIAFGALIRIFESVMTKCIPNPNINPEVRQRANNSQQLFQESRIQIKMKRIQTYFIRRAFDSIQSIHQNGKTSNIRLLQYLISHLQPIMKLPVKPSGVNEKRDAELLIVSIEDIVKSYDLMTILTDEMISYSRSAANKLSGNSSIHQNMVDNSILVGSMYTHKDSVLYRKQLIQMYVARCFELIVLHYNMQHHEAIETPPSGKRKRDDFEVVNRISNIVEEESNHNNSPSCDNSINFVNETDYNLCQKIESVTSESPMISLLPTQDHITQIWHHFVLHSVSQSTADCVIEMLYFLISSTEYGVSSTQIVEWRREITRVLYPLCCNLNASSITVAGYKLLIYCMGQKNALEGNFQTIPDNIVEKCNEGESDSRAMSNIVLGLSHGFGLGLPCASSSLHLCSKSLITKISNYKISGLKKLWSIILDVHDEGVANMAMIYIAVFYTFSQSQSDINSNMGATEQVGFAQQCVAELNSHEKSNSSLKRRKRTLYLVKLFVQYAVRPTSNSRLTSSNLSHGSFSDKINAVQVEDIIGVSLPFSILIQVVNNNGPKFAVQCPLGKNTKIAFVRDSIIRYFSSGPQQDFRLVFSGCELKDDLATLETYRVTAKSLVSLFPRLSTKHVKKSIHVVEPLIEDDRSNGTNCKSAIQDDISCEEISPTAKIKKPPSPVDNRDPLENKNYAILPGVAELLSEKCMKTLFSLLSSDISQEEENLCELRALVWDLLQLLPTEPLLLEGVHAIFSMREDRIDDIIWTQLLPFPTSNGTRYYMLFRLMYSLQVVERSITDLCARDVSNPANQVDNGRVPNDDLNPEQHLPECIVVDDNLNVDNADMRKQNGGNHEAIVVIDDDDDDDDDNLPQMKVDDEIDIRGTNGSNHNKSRRSVESFISHAGLKHLINIFLSLDASNFESKSISSKSRDHEISTLTITCANKLIFLILNLTSNYEENARDPRISLATSGECSPFFTHLLKVIHWAVSFQLRSTMKESQSSKYISGGWSSAEIGGALALQCLSMIKIITARASQIPSDVRFMNPFKSDVLADAMSSSIVNSPSKIVRSASLPIFKQLLFLHEREGKSNTRENTISNGLTASFHFSSPSLSVLVALLPVGREFFPSNRRNNEEIYSRCSVLFDLVNEFICKTWSILTDDFKQTGETIFIKQLVNPTVAILADNSLSRPPNVKGIDELGILLTWVIKEFKVLRVKECTFFGAYIEGLLSLLQSVILLFGSNDVNSTIAGIQVTEEQSLLQMLFESGTYYLQIFDGRATPRCATFSMRKKIMDLLNVLCKGSIQNQETLLDLVLSHIYSKTPRKDLNKDWSIDPLMKQKSITGHVGMKNQGATCYLNSLLQQFFHTPALRLGILSCDLHNINDPSEEHRLLLELQRLFGNLLMSEKRDYDTVDLVKSIRGYDGNPIRPGEQQDVDEFFNLFCERLETALKKLPQSRLLHDVFGGQLSHLITCQKCHYSSVRTEDFLSISLDVKGKHDIFESLQSYIRGEVLDGANKYHCSKCDAKRDSIKRCCIKTLPNVLICHLKRFDFDLEMLRKVKVNDRFEFPTELNMSQYTTEGLDETNHPALIWRGENYYKYTLRGVLVHAGTADSGHYYSLSHVRNYDPIHPNQNHEKGGWFCLNDSIVSPFDPSTLEISTFGGLNEPSAIGPLKRFDSTKSYSAYLLIYDRVDQYAFDEQMVNEPKKMENPAKPVDLRLWENGIVEENVRHVKDQITFSPEYGTFVTDICKGAFKNKGPSASFKAVQVLTFHLFENLVHTRDRMSEIEKTFTLLSSWYNTNADSCRWFLKLLYDSHQHWMEKIFLNCYRSEIRISFVRLLDVVFKKLSPLERKNYYTFDSMTQTDSELQNDDGFDADGDTIVYYNKPETTTISRATLKRVQYWKSKSVLALFIGRVLNLLDNCESHWRRFDQIFECLTKFASCGQDEAIFLIRCGTILRLVDLYQGEKGNVPPGLMIRPPTNHGVQESNVKNKARVKMGDRDKRPNFLPLLSLLSELIRSGKLYDDSDFDVSDSEDSSLGEKNDLEGSKTSMSNINNSFMTKKSKDALHISGSIYELPRRDSFYVTRRELLVTMLNEVAPQNTYNKDRLFQRNALARTVGKIACHICFDNFEKTLNLCASALRVIKDRQANESTIAVQVLTSLLHIKDKHLHQRIQSATTSIFEGLDANAEYEKELLLLLGVVHNELSCRTPGEMGSEDEVCFHGIIIENLDKIISLFGQNITNCVKHKILGVVKSLLPIRKTPLLFGKEECKSTKMISLAYHGYSLQDTNYLEGEVNSAMQQHSTVPQNVMSKYLDEEDVKDKIFIALKDLYMNVADAITSQCSTSRNDYLVPQGHHGGMNHLQLMDSSTFFEYFAALRGCLTGPRTETRLKRDEHWIHDITEYLLPAFWEVDNDGRNQIRSSADILKGEIIRFFERLVELDPKQFINAILDGSVYSSSSGVATQPINVTSNKTVSDPVTKMMEVFIISNNNFDYNNTYMVHFYSLLAMLAEKNEHFYNKVLNHENWKWALKAFVLNQNVAKSGRLYDVILCNTIKYVQDNDKFRKSIFQSIVPNDGKESFLEQNPDSGVLKLLCAIFDSEVSSNEENECDLVCIFMFVTGKCGGMSKISSVTKKVFSQLPEPGIADDCLERVNQVKILEHLFLCIHCMHLIINALDIKDVRNVMVESWPEVDEINSIFTQIITRAEDDEWIASLQDSHRMNHIDKIVSTSRDLQQRLIDASTNIKRRQ